MTLREPSYRELIGFVSRVRTCASADTVTAIRARAADLLGEPVDNCRSCGQPVLPDDVCPCLQHPVRDHHSFMRGEREHASR